MLPNFKLFTFLLFITFWNFISYSQPKGSTELFLEGGYIFDIKQNDKEIWVATYGNGIFKYTKETQEFENFSTKNNRLDIDFFYTIEVSDNFIWAGSTDGLSIYDRKKNTWTKRKFAGGELSNWVRALYYDKKSNVLWIGRFKNLTRYDIAKSKYSDLDKSINSDPKTNNFTVIKPDGDSLIWFGTEAGVHKFSKKSPVEDESAWTFYNTKNGFAGESESVAISNILVDGPYVWFGTYEFITPEKPKFNLGGLYRFNRKHKWDRLSKSNGLTANGIHGLEITGNLVWASMYAFEKEEKKELGKGLVLVDHHTGFVTPLDLNETAITTSTINKIQFDGTNLWFATNKGLFRIQLINPLSRWSGKRIKSQKK